MVHFVGFQMVQFDWLIEARLAGYCQQRVVEVALV